jgi:hypothetical protein
VQAVSGKKVFGSELHAQVNLRPSAAAILSCGYSFLGMRMWTVRAPREKAYLSWRPRILSRNIRIRIRIRIGNLLCGWSYHHECKDPRRKVAVKGWPNLKVVE